MKTRQELYDFYFTTARPIYTELQAINNQTPIELLFELQAAFDHLSRQYTHDKTEEQVVDKAYNHIKRGLLDCFKLKLKYFNHDLEALRNGRIDLSLIDHGEFEPRIIAHHADIIDMAQKARLIETDPERFDDTVAAWADVSTRITDARQDIFGNTRKIEWAKAKTKRYSAKTMWISASASALLGWILGNIDTIIGWIKKMTAKP